MDHPDVRRLVIGVGLFTIPWLAYPGNWSSTAPGSPSAQLSWTADAVLVYVTLLLGVGLVALTAMRTVRRFGAGTLGPRWLRALAGVVADRRNRVALVLAGLAYAIFFSFFTGLVAIIPSAPSAGETRPSISAILCCGPPGTTPGVVIGVVSYLQLAANPMTLLLLAVGLPLFAVNVAAAAHLVRRGYSAGTGVATGTTGALGTLLVNCPSCGTILLANALAGTGAAGALVGWTQLQTPLLLAAFPIAISSLWFAGRQLERPSVCPRPQNDPD
jgi:MFS family permease